MTVIGLVYVHIHLQKGIAHLRKQFLAPDVESRFAEFYSQQEKLKSALDELKSRDKGTEVLNRGIEDTRDEIRLLNLTTEYLITRVTVLESRIAKYPTLVQLPKNLDNLKKTIGDQGSDMTRLKHTLDELSKRLDALGLEGTKDQGGRSDFQPQSDAIDDEQPLLNLKTFISSLEKWNKTLTSELSGMTLQTQHQLMLIQDLQNATSLLDNRLSLVELRGGCQ